MAEIVAKKTPGKVDPFGTGKVLVVDCLSPFPAEVTDPFLMLHAFGPAHISAMPTFGMHPHRGFCEVPYLKKGKWYATDPWNMRGEGEDAKMLEGQCGAGARPDVIPNFPPLPRGHSRTKSSARSLPMHARCSRRLQFGKAGRGIEHGMRKDEVYDGLVQGFQMWVNLKSENKLDPPVFQNARPDALPLLLLSPKAKAKLLVGTLQGQASPVDSFGVDCVYTDYMLENGGEASCARTPAQVSAFAYVYEGKGTLGVSGTVVAAGETVRFGPVGDLVFEADQGSNLGVMVLVGTPLKEPIIQRAQLRRTNESRAVSCRS